MSRVLFYIIVWIVFTNSNLICKTYNNINSDPNEESLDNNSSNNFFQLSFETDTTLIQLLSVSKEIESFQLYITTPNISTKSISNVNYTTCLSGGDITDDGGAYVSARGICWSTSTNPNITNDKTISGTGIGSFIDTIRGLNSNSTYYVRAYATNSAGTSYGNEISFKTTLKKLYAWGENTYGTLGDSTTSNRTSPIQIGNSSNWLQIDCGYNHNIALKNDYSFWSWGDNSSGQLSDSTTIQRISPNQVGMTLNCFEVVGSSSSSFEIGQDGKLWGAGWNAYGQLGDGTIINKTSPVKIGNDTNWSQISGGFCHTVAIKKNGTLWAWGYNGDGRLGDSSTTNRYTPVRIGTGTNWKQVSCGDVTSLAIKYDGTLWGWGSNFFGELGNGTTTGKISPIQIGTETNWAKVSCGVFTTFAIKKDGTLWAWGLNDYGQLGDGTTTNKTLPTQVGSSSNWSSISAGWYHTLALKNNGTIWAWGNNSYGQLGDSSFVDKHSPKQIGYGNNWSQIACGYNYSVALENVITLPTISTKSITNIRTSNAITGGILTSDGGTSETIRGVCWANTANPTISDNKTNDGKGTGSFVSSLNGLITNTKYYLRAYATNSAGTVYGNEINFTTARMDLILKAGWNLISLNYTPYEPDSMQYITKDISSNLVIAKNGLGKTYIPAYSINQIGKWNVLQGYQFYMSKPDTLGILGTEITPEKTNLLLNSGWNMISYLRNSQIDASIALGSITDSNRMVVAKNGLGKTYIPSFSINQIGNLIPGEGYQVYMSANDTLIYPPNGSGKLSVNTLENIEPKVLKCSNINTGNNSTLIFLMEAEDNSEIAIYNSKEDIIGSSFVRNGISSITIWGDDSQTEKIEGAIENELITAKIYNPFDNSLKPIKINKIVSVTNRSELQKLTFGTNSILKVISAIELETNQLRAIPNPFTNSLEITYTIGHSSDVNLAIYDIAGKKIITLINEFKQSGIYTNFYPNIDLMNGEYNLILVYGNTMEMMKLLYVK